MAASRHELASLMDGLGFCVVRQTVSPEGWTMTSLPGTLRRCLGSSIRQCLPLLRRPVGQTIGMVVRARDDAGLQQVCRSSRSDSAAGLSGGD
jgi:hypothetical protein